MRYLIFFNYAQADWCNGELYRCSQFVGEAKTYKKALAIIKKDYKDVINEDADSIDDAKERAARKRVLRGNFIIYEQYPVPANQYREVAGYFYNGNSNSEEDSWYVLAIED